MYKRQSLELDIDSKSIVKKINHLDKNLQFFHTFYY